MVWVFKDYWMNLTLWLVDVILIFGCFTGLEI